MLHELVTLYPNEAHFLYALGRLESKRLASAVEEVRDKPRVVRFIRKPRHWFIGLASAVEEVRQTNQQTDKPINQLTNDKQSNEQMNE